MSRVVVFLGPSLPVAEARRELPDALFLGPARRGDITRAVLDRRPTAVLLIDGLFNSVPAVVHKEILFALSEGVRVTGAASMGALRAAELWPYGMDGVGEIYRRFRSGAWEADDEVAVTHGPAESGYRAASVALATIRLGLERARDLELLTADAAAGIIEDLRCTFYPERSWHAVFASARNHGMSEDQIAALKAFVATEKPDAKRDDALQALRAVSDWICSPAADEPPPAVEFHFEPTIFWRRLLAEIRAAAPIASDLDDGDVDYQALVRDARLRKDSRELYGGAALLHLLMTQADDTASAPTGEELQRAVNRFRRRRGLHTADQARAFYREQHLTDDDITLLAQAEAALDALMARRPGILAGLLALELKRQGRFAEALQRTSAKQRHLRARGVTSLALGDIGLTLEELLDWYQDRFETIEGSLDAHAGTLGYESVRELLTEIMLEYQSRAEGPNEEVSEQ